MSNAQPSPPTPDVLLSGIRQALEAARAESAPTFASRELDMSKSVGEVVRGDCIREGNSYYKVVAIEGDEWEGDEVRGGEVVVKNLFLGTEVKRGDLQRVSIANFVCEIDAVRTFFTGGELVVYLPGNSASIRMASNSRQEFPAPYGLYLTDRPLCLAVNVWDKEKVRKNLIRSGVAVSEGLVRVIY